MDNIDEGYIRKSKATLAEIAEGIGKLKSEEFYYFDPTGGVDNILTKIDINSTERGIYANHICELVDLGNRTHDNIRGKVSKKLKDNVFNIGFGSFFAITSIATGIGYLINKGEGVIQGYIAGSMFHFLMSKSIVNAFVNRYYNEFNNQNTDNFIKERDKIYEQTLERLMKQKR